MKKITFLFVLFLIFFKSYSQTYNLKIYNYNFNAWTRDGRCGTNENWIEIRFVDNSTTWVNSGQGYSGSTSVLVNQNFSQKIYSVYFHTFIHERGGFPSDCNGHTASLDITSYVSQNGCNNGNRVTGSNSSSEAAVQIDFYYDINPIVNIIYPISNSIGYEDFFNIKLDSSSSNFNSNIYNWQYQIVDTAISQVPQPNLWLSMPTYTNGQTTFDFLPSSLFDVNVTGKKIFFRINTCGLLFSPNVISYTIIKSAPHITSFQTEKTTCFDSKDGKVKLYFDRFPVFDEIINEELKYVISTIDINGNPTSIGDAIVDMDINKIITISNLEAGRYEIKLKGSINSEGSSIQNPTYNGGVNHKILFTISKPRPVDFSTTKVDVWCNGGNDGAILITALGGTNQTPNDKYKYKIDENDNWLPFTNANTHTIIGLTPGNYKIKVKDSKDCISRVQATVNGQIELGVVKELSNTITQPTAPVNLEYPLNSSQQPTFFGATNGRIVAAITGGTRFANNSYSYEWKNSAGAIQTNCTTAYGNGIYNISLTNVPADTYTLTVKDKNYDAATNKIGCTVANSTFVLSQPAKIEITLSVLNPISCNENNQYGNETNTNPLDEKRDESQNGKIKAVVTGGVQLAASQNGGLPYYYRWKKFLNGAWVNWNNVTNGNTIDFISDGNYSLNVEDKNGIVLGNYNSINELATETPATILAIQPAKLDLTFSKTDVSCSSNPSGSATANPIGGIPPYTYQWSNGETTQTISGLIANNYFVNITDSKGCKMQGSIALQQPNGVVLNENAVNPTCFGGNDGKIITALTGGTPPYSYQWTTARNQDLADTPNLENQPQGTYDLLVTDGNGCTYTSTYNLVNPTKLVIDLGANRTLCNNQNVVLNAAIIDRNASYEWSSDKGFNASTAEVSLTQAGTYHVKVTSSLGCIAEDDITISTSQASIDSEFLLASQAYIDEEIILINISYPLGQNTVWQIPNNVTIVSQDNNYIVLKFNSIGSYSIGLKQTQGDCYALYNKTINVEQRTTQPNSNTSGNSFINNFVVTPNPSDGIFSVAIGLEQISPVNLRLFAVNGQTAIEQKSAMGQKSYAMNFSLPALSEGTYFLVLETANQTMVKRIIIAR